MDAGEPLPGVLAGLTLSPQSELDTEPEPELEPDPEPESDPDRDPEPASTQSLRLSLSAANTAAWAVSRWALCTLCDTLRSAPYIAPCNATLSQYRGLGQRLAAEGFVAVIVGYETWPLADAAAQARAVRAALRHATAHAAEWGGDASRVFLSGQSSGAHISALALLDEVVASGADIDGVGGGNGGVCVCAGLIGMSGVYDVAAHYAYETSRGVAQACNHMCRRLQPRARDAPRREGLEAARL